MFKCRKKDVSCPNKGQVVQSIVSLMKSLVKDFLRLLVSIKSTLLIFFFLKMWGDFAVSESMTHFFAKMAVFLRIMASFVLNK